MVDAESFATRLVMLYDGASFMGQMERCPVPAHAAQEAAAALLEAAPKVRRGRRGR